MDSLYIILKLIFASVIGLVILCGYGALMVVVVRHLVQSLGEGTAREDSAGGADTNCPRKSTGSGVAAGTRPESMARPDVGGRRQSGSIAARRQSTFLVVLTCVAVAYALGHIITWANGVAVPVAVTALATGGLVAFALIGGLVTLTSSDGEQAADQRHPSSLPDKDDKSACGCAASEQTEKSDR